MTIAEIMKKHRCGYRHAEQLLEGMSVRPPSESAGPLGALALARGCLEVSSAEILGVAGVLDWLTSSNPRHQECYRQCAEILRLVATSRDDEQVVASEHRRIWNHHTEEMLRRFIGIGRQAESATERQPPDNIAVRHAEDGAKHAP